MGGRGSDDGGGEGRRRRRSEDSPRGTEEGAGPAAGIPAAEAVAPGTTGRYLVLLREDAIDAGVSAMADAVGVTAIRTADAADGTADADTLAGGGTIVFDNLGVAVVETPPDRFQALSAASAEEGAILAIEPERIVYALADAWSGGPAVPPAAAPAAGLPVGYLQGYRDAVNHLVDRVLGAAGVPAAVPAEAGVALSETELTWGLQVTKAAASRYTGRGIKVAVLDTGLDLLHPDFVGRRIVSRSFVPGEAVQDRHGHGTHCIGTACGPQQPGQLPRYGVAYEADIFAGKVLSNQGSGSDAGILAGIDWAIANGCTIVSMSLGASVCDLPNQSYSRVFENVARRALRRGTLIVAAAGNDSDRPATICPVSHPANCPSILAVGALDQRLQVAVFSNGGLNPEGGQVDIAGPGVGVRSSWPSPTLYRTISGTSMATPHVAGIAALLAEANPRARGLELATLLAQGARRLTRPSRDVGSGLVQAP